MNIDFTAIYAGQQTRIDELNRFLHGDSDSQLSSPPESHNHTTVDEHDTNPNPIRTPDPEKRVKLRDKITKAARRKTKPTSPPNQPSTNSSNTTMKSVKTNIIIFGEAGAGKSSLVNLIAGEGLAQTSSGVMGCTFESTPYEVSIPKGPVVTIWDTAGLHEASTGTVDTVTAINNIYKLTRYVEDGVSLLVYCVRGRITHNTVKNYEMFKAFCDGKVPIALVVTALEHESDKDLWWKTNESGFIKAGLLVDDHACITSKADPVRTHDYANSALAVRAMIDRAYLRDPWRLEMTSGFVRSVMKLISILFSRPSEGSQHLYEGLVRHGYSKAEAQKAVRKYEKMCK